MQPFPNIEEYDSIIINLQSLTQATFDKVHSKISGEMSKEINTLLETEREVFCIISQFKKPTAPANENIGRSRNYDWLPTTVVVTEGKPGASLNIINKRFERYLRMVGQWNLLLDLYEEPPLLRAFREQSGALLELTSGTVKKDFILLPIAENVSRKIIAGTLTYQGQKGEVGIHLLPPPTKCETYSGIEILLDMVYGQDVKTYPPWRNEIEVPGIKDVIRQIDEKNQRIKQIEDSIIQLESKVKELDTYRDLLSATGDELERVVQKTLGDIGIQTKKTEQGFPADLISDVIAVEVTGIKGSVGVGSEKVNQTGRFRESFRKNEKIILIANTYMGLEPSKREGKVDFTPEVKKYFDAIDVCCMTSKTLFELWRNIKTKKRKGGIAVRTILKHKGELTIKNLQ